MFPYRTLDNRLKTFALILDDMLQDLFAHAWRPKALDMVSNILFGLFCIWVSTEKIANLIGHGN